LKTMPLLQSHLALLAILCVGSEVHSAGTIQSKWWQALIYCGSYAWSCNILRQEERQ